MKRHLILASLVIIGACTATDPSPPVPPIIPVATTTAAATTTPATSQPPPTSQPEPTTTTTIDPSTVAWNEADAERHVTNYLAALAAGAYEQAAWSLENNGIALEGPNGEEAPVPYFTRSCADGACNGPYTVEALGPGLVDPATAQASSKVLVTHVASGESATIVISTFEGQLVISDLPPLVPSAPAPTLVEQLFGEDPPASIVIARFDAFELWEDGRSWWATNWFANGVHRVEGRWASAWTPNGSVVVSVDDPQRTIDNPCPTLLSRDGRVTILDRCWADEGRLFDAETGTELTLPLDLTPGGDGEWVSYLERADVVVTGSGDAEGNLTGARTLAGVDLLGDGYAGVDALSVDGRHYAYVDHRDPASFNHFWSPVLVVRDTRTGAEVGRWILEAPIGCLEFAAEWLVACEMDPSPTEARQLALTSVNIVTGETNRIETPVRLFLPIQPTNP